MSNGFKHVRMFCIQSAMHLLLSDESIHGCMSACLCLFGCIYEAFMCGLYVHDLFYCIFGCISAGMHVFHVCIDICIFNVLLCLFVCLHFCSYFCLFVSLSLSGFLCVWFVACVCVGVCAVCAVCFDLCLCVVVSAGIYVLSPPVCLHALLYATVLLLVCVHHV